MSDVEAALLAELQKLNNKLDVLIARQKRVEAATLTVALLAKRRKALSIAELVSIARDVEFARNPLPNNPDYQDWLKTRDEVLNVVHK